MKNLIIRYAASIAKPGQQFLVLFGAPGVGKGTFAKLLINDTKFNHISTGDEIRKILKGNTSKSFDPKLIATIKDIVAKGGLVSDEIVMNILQEKLKEPESAKGVILDGFPRTLRQLDLYEKILPTNVVVNVTLRADILLEKLAARRTCVGCGTAFNVCDINRDGYVMEPLNPKKEGICDACGGKLVVRDDDKKEVIEQRMKEYDEKTHPLLDRYRAMGVVIDFEVKKGKKDYPRLWDLVKQKLRV
ncbi:unnamed protein product [Paramecium octaurelia]|uniref:Adenylate kinase active site lid domain-containing protein n=1 Tax=Paramecium octaurelia TaxID=43137 RepID=A0A8S1WUR0_PAROT|nr:unnamed protein product [Paramecium octaurelia]